MSLSMSPGKIKDYAEKAFSTNIKILETQGKLAEGMIKRNTAAAVELADARMNSLRDMISVKSLTELNETNLAFEETVREKLTALYTENGDAIKEYREELKALLDLDGLSAKMKSTTEELSEKMKDLSEKAAGSSEEMMGKVKTFSSELVTKAKDIIPAKKEPVKAKRVPRKKPAPRKKTTTSTPTAAAS